MCIRDRVNADEIIAKRAFDLVNFEEDINTAVEEEVAFEVKIGPNLQAVSLTSIKMWMAQS